MYIYIWRSILKESHWFMIFQGQTIFPTVSSRSAMKRTLKQSKSQGKLQEWTFTKSRRTQKSILRAPLNELAFPKKNMDSLEASINNFAKPTKKTSPIDLSKTMNHLRWCPNHAILLLSRISNMSRACSMDASLPICHPPGKTTTVSSFDPKKTTAFHPIILSTSPLGPVHHAWHWGLAQSSPEKSFGRSLRLSYIQPFGVPPQKKPARKLNSKSPNERPQ